MSKSIRILLIHALEIFRHGLSVMLNQEGDIEVVGDCASVEEAISQMGRLRPDIVLIGTQVSGMNGIEATRALKGTETSYDGDVILLADSVDYGAQALEAGAASYLLEDVTSEGLARVIKEVFYSKHSLDDFTEETVELVVSSSGDAARLLGFMCRMSEMLQSRFRSIEKAVGSWDWGSVITIRLQRKELPVFLNELGNMPEVEKIEEQPLARGNLPGFVNRFNDLPILSISPHKRVCVTLKETGMAGQVLEEKRICSGRKEQPI